VRRGGEPDGVWGSYLVEEDGEGHWLYTPSHSLYRARRGDDVSFCHAGWPEPPGCAVIHYIPRSGWWFARWQHRREAHVAIDICKPARLQRNVWSYDDLWLDVIKFADGRVRVEDEDEFNDARREGNISEEEAAVCLETLRRLEARLARRDPLFDEDGWRKLALHSRGPFRPLTDFPD
jgi:hypothetical protein